MKTKFFGSVIVLSIIFIFSACNKEGNNGNGNGNGNNMLNVNGIVFNSNVDTKLAVEIPAVENYTRKNASGTKITSNAHSADFPGLYFIWDSKQKDNGYLKVSADVFDKYEGFTLTSKESNTYWDFNIRLQAGQQMTSDNCYVFFIPKVYNNKNINMVFISGYLLRETPIIPEEPIEEVEGCTTTYTLISGYKNNGFYVVDPYLLFTTYGDLKAYWSNTISANYPTDWAVMMGITAKGNTARWIWDRMDSWETGFSGSNIINTVSEFNLQGNIVESTVPFYFACDNAAVVFVNGVRVHWTTVAFEDKGVPDDPIIGFTDFSANAFNGDVWQHLYKVDIKGYLQQGANKIVIVAANSDDNNGRWNIDNNPAGLIYACKFTASTCIVPVD